MGSSESKQENVIQELKQQINQLMSTSDKQKEIQELQDQIKELKSIDRNHDSKISKEELEKWANNKNQELEEFKAKLRADLESQKHIEFEAKYIEMQKHIDTLTSINKNLEGKIASRDNNQNLKVSADASGTSSAPSTQNQTNDKNNIINLDKSEISKSQIDSFVEKLLSDKNVNVKYLPDFVERQIYRNVFTILLGLIENMADSTEIHIMGHRIVMHVAPEASATQPQSDKTKLTLEHGPDRTAKNGSACVSDDAPFGTTSASLPDTTPDQPIDVSDDVNDEGNKSFDSEDFPVTQF